ncbi:MAG: response regulator [Acidobacteriota bacterium]|nr:response regulator [Acidobacteriota bacterium]
MSAKPVVYFIDDSATMREVIKIAFRRENLDVITCHDASSAMDLMDHTTPDIVITDVIMPGRDGYEVCQYIKQHPHFGQTPVILMSGVVNKGVAERAFAVQANELIRKPFQPQDLIARVRHLLKAPQEAEVTAAQANEDASAVLSSIFNGPAPGRPGHNPLRSAAGPVPVPPRITQRPPVQVPSIAATVAAALQPTVMAPPVSIPGAQITGNAQLPVPAPQPGRVPSPPVPGHGTDTGRLRLEILRMQSQIKKLETELVAEREYSKALEVHLNTLSEQE